MIGYIIIGFIFIAIACVWNYYEIHESVGKKNPEEKKHTKKV